MITIIISVLISVSMGIWRVYHDEIFNDLIDYIMPSVLNCLIGIVLGSLVAIILPMDLYCKKYSFDIQSLQDNSTISGNFFLGSGNIEGKMKYVFYYKDKEVYKMMQLDYDAVGIIYSDSNPKVNVSQMCPTNSFINYFALDLDCCCKKYIIEIPKGTIKNDYNLDAQ